MLGDETVGNSAEMGNCGQGGGETMEGAKSEKEKRGLIPRIPGLQGVYILGMVTLQVIETQAD